MGLKETLVLPVARHWISGVDMDSALKDARAANSKGIGVVVNFLGEEIKEPSTADAHAKEYVRLQQALAEGGIRGFPSVKLTQLGLAINEEEARRRLEVVASNADRLGQLLWVDMEGSRFTDATISTYLEAHDSHKGLGLAVQAYMRRSEQDLKRILDRGGKVRLVKGAYKEGRDSVFTTRDEVRQNYSKLLELLFKGGDGFAVATHDSVLIDKAKEMAGTRREGFRFEMLKGIRDELKVGLSKEGYKVFEYLPYGDEWYAYSRRRIGEHPSNVWLLLRSLF